MQAGNQASDKCAMTDNIIPNGLVGPIGWQGWMTEMGRRGMQGGVENGDMDSLTGKIPGPEMTRVERMQRRGE